LYVNEVVLGTAFGVLMGPYVANVLNPRSWGTDTPFITREVTRIVLATGLFAIGVELPRSYTAKHAKSLIYMVVPTMAIGWAIVSALLYGLFPQLSFFSCLAIAACLTPTDPIICAAIVGGKYAKKHVPLSLRQILSAESAANDGLAFPFLSISLYLVTEPTKRAALNRWILIGWFYEVILGIIVGAVLGIDGQFNICPGTSYLINSLLAGLVFSDLMKFSHRRGYINRESYVAQYLALAIFISGIVSTIGSDDLLATFAAGCAISWDGEFNDHIEGEAFAPVIDFMLNCGCFVYIGAWLPFESFNAPELGIVPWRLVVLFLVILAFRRIPALLFLYMWIPAIETWREALFTGHFALQMGIGAVFISSLALHQLPKPQNPPQNEEQMLAACLEPIVAFIVLGSIIIRMKPSTAFLRLLLIHRRKDGLSIPLFSLCKHMLTRKSTKLVNGIHQQRFSSVDSFFDPINETPADSEILCQSGVLP
ncbi:hypothetical protein H0H81_002662, partial [Sphagnurus paluster]